MNLFHRHRFFPKKVKYPVILKKPIYQYGYQLSPSEQPKQWEDRQATHIVKECSCGEKEHLEREGKWEIYEGDVVRVK